MNFNRKKLIEINNMTIKELFKSDISLSKIDILCFAICTILDRDDADELSIDIFDKEFDEKRIKIFEEEFKDLMMDRKMPDNQIILCLVDIRYKYISLIGIDDCNLIAMHSNLINFIHNRKKNGEFAANVKLEEDKLH